MLPKIEELAIKQAELCGVFGNAKRVLILWALLNREMSVGDIALAIEASLQSTSQHLRLMKDKGILVSRQEGQMVYYRIADNDRMRDCQMMIRGRQLEALREK